MFSPAFIVAYFSPETVLPVTSVVAAVLGVVMMFGRTCLRLVTGKAWRSLKSRSQPRRSVARPHFTVPAPGSENSEVARPHHQPAAQAEPEN